MRLDVPGNLIAAALLNRYRTFSLKNPLHVLISSRSLHSTAIMQNGTDSDPIENGCKFEHEPTKKSQFAGYQREWSLIEGVFDLIRTKLSQQALAKTEKINKYYSPDALKKKLDLNLHAVSNEDWSSILTKCHEICDHSIKTGHRFFLQQLYHGIDPYGLAATLLIEALNTSIYTFDVGPVTTLIENEVVENMVNLCGWPEGDGIFCPGGSTANFYGINLARFHADQNVKTKGMRDCFAGKRPLIYANEQCHYSAQKGAAFLGFGTDSVVSVKSDSDGRMIVDELRRAIEQTSSSDSVPMMVLCTGGTTVLNAYDPIVEVADVCKQHSIWMHVDICLGGAALFSSKHRHLIEGIERADSLSWCWHKVLNAPFQTCVFLCRHKGLLKACHSQSASYLFATDKHYDTSYDTGDASVQCGRKADALKVWMMWKARGREGIARLVDQAFEITEYATEQMRRQSDVFKLVIGKSQGTSVCFWVIPASLRGQRSSMSEEQYNNRLNALTQTIKGELVQRGLGMVACQPLPCHRLPNFLRLTFGCHPLTSRQDIDEFLEILKQLADKV